MEISIGSLEYLVRFYDIKTWKLLDFFYIKSNARKMAQMASISLEIKKHKKYQKIQVSVKIHV